MKAGSIAVETSWSTSKVTPLWDKRIKFISYLTPKWTITTYFITIWLLFCCFCFCFFHHGRIGDVRWIQICLVSLYVCLSVYLSVYSSVYLSSLSACLVCRSVCLPFYLCACQFICLSILSVCFSVWSVCQTVLSVYFDGQTGKTADRLTFSVCQLFDLFARQLIRLFCLSVSQSVCRSVWFLFFSVASTEWKTDQGRIRKLDEKTPSHCGLGISAFQY